MTNNVIDLNEHRSKRNIPTDDFQDFFEKSGLSAASLSFMQSLIELLYEHGIDPQEPETAENMILLSMLFESHIDKMNGEDNVMYEIFNMMRVRCMTDE